MIRADNVFVDDDEGRFILIVRTDEGETLRIDIHDDVLKFYDQVRREIGPYAAEAESARAAVAAGVPLEDYIGATVPADEQADGYTLDDPKHPTYYERMVD